LAAPAAAYPESAKHMIGPGSRVKPQILTVEKIHQSAFACGDGQMRNRPSLVGQQSDTPGTELLIVLIESDDAGIWTRRCEIIEQAESG
jgi:hypothetical protein